MARAITRFAGARDELVLHATSALAFAAQHDSETEFARRMEHYRACSSKPVPTAR